MTDVRLTTKQIKAQTELHRAKVQRDACTVHVINAVKRLLLASYVPVSNRSYMRPLLSSSLD